MTFAFENIIIVAQAQTVGGSINSYANERKEPLVQ